MVFYILFISSPSKTLLLKLFCPPTGPRNTASYQNSARFSLTHLPHQTHFSVFFFSSSLLFCFLRAAMVSQLTICPKLSFLLHNFITKYLMFLPVDSHSATNMGKSSCCCTMQSPVLPSNFSAGCYTSQHPPETLAQRRTHSVLPGVSLG